VTRTITRAAVVGGGTMGGGIAAHFANAGIPVYLMDIAPAGMLERIKKHKPAPFVTAATASLVTAGPLNDEWLAEADWIIEAVFENLEVKRELVARIDRVRKPDSIVTSNTSGIPIAQVAAEASPELKKNFLGTHFFNPPRYMKLLEVIPTRDTDPEITKFVTDFAAERLGKSVVLCKDTPNFIANRLASMGGATLMDFVLERGDYTIEEVDAIVGPLLGRPKTAAFRLQDLVGFDVSASVQANLYPMIEGDESREVLRSARVEELRKSQLDRGRLGDKTKQGFYKKDGKTIQTLDLKTGEYRERQEPQIASLAEAAKIRELPKRVQFVLQQDDKAGVLARHVLYNALGYAARRVPEISDDLASIDRAVRWGFSHDLGPFELWDALGVKATADAMEANGVAVAPWVRDMLAAGNETFYRDGSAYDPATKSYAPIPKDPKQLSLRDGRVVKENKSASLIDLGDGVLCFEIHSKMNTLDEDVRTLLEESIRELESGDWQGLVIGNEGTDFCIGANLKILGAGTVEERVRKMQDAFMALRYCAKPVVAALHARVLAGGCEMALHAARIVAASETYIGLVEVGVGLIPGAGGCKELVRRVVSPPLKRTPVADPLPFVQNVAQTLGMAKVSSSAAEARELGYLSEGDRIVMNRDHLLHEAKQEVLELAADGYTPPVREKNCYAGGRDVRAALKTGIYMLRQGGYISDYDAYVAGKLAHILAGGELSHAEWVDEQYFLDLEREAFADLTAQPKTQERIQYMMEHGKPLRN